MTWFLEEHNLFSYSLSKVTRENWSLSKLFGIFADDPSATNAPESDDEDEEDDDDVSLTAF